MAAKGMFHALLPRQSRCMSVPVLCQTCLNSIKISNDAHEIEPETSDLRKRPLYMTYGAAIKLARRTLNIPKSHVNDALAMDAFHPKERIVLSIGRSVAATTISWKIFCDAKRIDRRDGKEKSGQELFRGYRKRRESRLPSGKETQEWHDCSRQKQTVTGVDGLKHSGQKGVGAFFHRHACGFPRQDFDDGISHLSVG